MTLPFVVTFSLSWAAFLLFGDKSKWRLFLPSCLLAVVMSLLSDKIMHEVPLWTYHDPTGAVKEFYIGLLDDIGIYPVVTYLFLQFYPAHPKRRILYFFLWTTFVILLEILYVSQGWMKHRYGWSIGMSYGADWLIFYLLLTLRRCYDPL